MSDKWETVVGPKRKPKVQLQPPTTQSNGQPLGSGSGTIISKKNKVKKYSAKTPASFPLIDDSDPDLDIVNAKPVPEKRPKVHKKQVTSSTDSRPKEKRRDLQNTLDNVSAADLLLFYQELQNAGSVQNVCLSWIKYSADALNSTLQHALPPQPSQWPNDLNYPHINPKLTDVIKTIIQQTAKASGDFADALGVSYSSLLATIPTLIQRGDPGWGYLLFLRELCRLDPSLPIRRWKSGSELMDSYGNRKEIGLCILWTIAQAGVDSPYVLKIISQYLMPYYGYKNYKQFVLASLEQIACRTNMAVQPLIESNEFDEFFEAAFDPKKKPDLEKIYSRVKEIVVKGLKDKGNGSELFLKFLHKTGDKDFSRASPYGKEVFDILLSCLEHDLNCFLIWRENISTCPTESSSLLHHMAQTPEAIKYSNKRSVAELIQSDEFVVSSVKHPELLQSAKKVQTKLDSIAASQKRIFSWKMLILVVGLAIGALFSLDVSENGKGVFENSNTGRFFQKYGILNEVLMVWETLSGLFRYSLEFISVLFRSVYKAVQPLLQRFLAQVQEYIPQLNYYLTLTVNLLKTSLNAFTDFIQENIFIGVLSPENLRKLTKESLSFMWTNILHGFEEVYIMVGKYIS